MKELGLKLPLIPRQPASFTPVERGGLLLGDTKQADYAQIKRYSTNDADRYFQYEKLLGLLGNSIQPLLDVDVGDFSSATIKAAFQSSARFLKLKNDIPTALSLFLGSARNQLNSWFETEILKATLATDALIGTFAGPSSPGTGYILLHHIMGNGPWSYVRGGMGTISQLLANTARYYGAEILVNTEVNSLSKRPF